jgi:hypothetical protein
VYFCYVDDSGAEDGRTLTGLLIPSARWNELLACWLDGRAKLSEKYGVNKHRELKGSLLGKKGRGSFCDGQDQDERFQSPRLRTEAYRILLESLSHCDGLQVVTVACRISRLPKVYQCLVDWLEDWAAAKDEHVIVFLDGKQLPDTVSSSETATAVARETGAAIEDSSRNSAPFRQSHRALALQNRRVLEDPVMQDSRYSQLIQAADVTAYAAFQHLRILNLHDEELSFPGSPSVWAASAYAELANSWVVLDAGQYGIIWRDTAAE